MITPEERKTLKVGGVIHTVVEELECVMSGEVIDNNTGEKKSKAEYHRVVIFGKLAEITGEHVKKGFLLYASGQLQTRKWQDQSGQDRYTTEVVINPIGGTLQILGPRSDDANQQQSQQPINRPIQQNEPSTDFDDQEIPF